ncbi:hypothetical protein JXR93_11150 [bacterium]|nr:hypothetical protein [bacterium]
MKKFLVFVFLLCMSLTVLGANDTVKEDKFQEMDQSLDSFDTETDDEAMDSLREKIKNKKAESSLEESNNSTTTEKTSENRDEAKNNELKNSSVEKKPILEDSNFSTKNSTTTHTTTKEEYYEDDDGFDKTMLQMLSFGGGFQEFEHPASEHIGLEYGIYAIPEVGFWLSGFTVGVGIVDLDESYDDSQYLSLSYSALIMPFGIINSPFLRFDIGVMGIGWVEDENYDETDPDDEDDSNFEDVGVLFKAGGGFIFGGNDFSLSLQLLYTIHKTTAGDNEGVEFQLGFHF